MTKQSFAKLIVWFCLFDLENGLKDFFSLSEGYFQKEGLFSVSKS